MNQTFIIAAIVACVVSFLLGGTAGYKWNYSEVVKLEAVVQSYEQKTKELEEKLIQVRKDFAVLSSEFQTKTRQFTSKVQEFEATSKALVASRTEEIAKLKLSVQNNNNNLSLLRSQLDKAQSDREVVEIQAQIFLQEKLILEQRLRTQGLECLTVPVPQEYLDNLNLLKS